MFKKIIYFSYVFILSLIICGCQAVPESVVVASKNDGTFEAALNNTVTDVEEKVSIEDSSEGEQEQLGIEVYSDSFTNSTGTIFCTVQFEKSEDENSIAMPVIQITPHEITSEEAERIACILFGDTEIFEYSEEMTKAQIEEMILSLKLNISNRDEMLEYYDGDEDLTDQIISQYEAMIGKYEQLYQTAPDRIENKLCDWVFRPLTYYEDLTALETVSNDFENYNKNQYIKGLTEINGFPYVYSVCNRNESDYRIHNIFAYRKTAGATWESYSMEEQNEEEILAKVQVVLDQLDMGDWEICSCKTGGFETVNGKYVYNTTVIACPVYSGISVTYQPQLMNLKTGDAYASNYYYEQISFDYSGGELISFQYQSPMDVVNIVNDDVELLPFDTIMEHFKTRMEMGVLTSEPGDMISMASSMSFLVNEMEFGLVRTRIKNNETDFYLVPAYTFRGDYTLYDENGEIMFSNTDIGNSPMTLLVINAVDGSIINTQLGY